MVNVMTLLAENLVDDDQIKAVIAHHPQLAISHRQATNLGSVERFVGCFSGEMPLT
jgi:hypothetical protein